MWYTEPPQQPRGSEETFLRARGGSLPACLLLGGSVRAADVPIICGCCCCLLATRRHPPPSGKNSPMFSTNLQPHFVSQQVFGVVKALGFKEFITLED